RVGTLTIGETRYPVYYVGYDPGTGDGGPWRLEEGSARIGADELVLDAALAHDRGLKVGDMVDVGPERLRIAGLSPATSAGYPYVFLDRGTATKLFAAPDVYTFVLVKVAQPGQAAALAQRLEATIPNASAF